MLRPSGKAPTAVGAYVFAGGHAVGAARHFEVLAHLEGRGAYGARTFKLNFPWVPVYHGPDRWPLQQLSGADLDWLYCNPPCAIVSVAGRSITAGRDNWRTDPRTNCIHECFNAFEVARPRCFTLESVTNLFSTARELVDDLAVKATRLGYHVTHLFVDAKWHGVAQNRKRYFFVATRGRFQYHSLNYAPPTSCGEVLLECRREFGDQVGLVTSNGHERYYALAGPCERIRAVWEREHPESTWVRNAQGVVGRPKMLEFRMDPTRPMSAFIGDFFVHPTEPRRIGLREALRLCNFPDDWQFACSHVHAFSELARGVMPPVADWLARSLRLTLERDVERADGARGDVEVVDLRKPPSESHQERRVLHAGGHV